VDTHTHAHTHTHTHTYTHTPEYGDNASITKRNSNLWNQRAMALNSLVITLPH